MPAPHPSPLPSGERDGVRGFGIWTIGIYLLFACLPVGRVFAPYHIFERTVLLTIQWSGIANGPLHWSFQIGTGFVIWCFYCVTKLLLPFCAQFYS